MRIPLTMAERMFLRHIFDRMNAILTGKRLSEKEFEAIVKDAERRKGEGK